MNRRQFIKGALVTTEALALGGTLETLASASKTDKGDKNKMKILVITGSPR